MRWALNIQRATGQLVVDRNSVHLRTTPLIGPTSAVSLVSAGSNIPKRWSS